MKPGRGKPCLQPEGRLSTAPQGRGPAPLPAPGECVLVEHWPQISRAERPLEVGVPKEPSGVTVHS